jgi:phosphatidylglycerophosphate synthase
VFYCCNNHPLLTFCFSDRKSHPYKKRHLFLEFIAITSTSIFGIGMNELNCFPIVARLLVSICLVTIPTSFYRAMAFYFFTTPCCVKDNSTGQSRKDHCCVSCCKAFSRSFAVWISIVWITFTLTIGILSIIQANHQDTNVCEEQTTGQKAISMLWSISQCKCLFLVILLYSHDCFSANTTYTIFTCILDICLSIS